jgi:hypothetical protein
VLQWLAEPGENVMPGRPILLFGDESMEVRVKAHEKDVVAGIHIGTGVILFPDEPDRVRAEVSNVAPMATGSGRMFEVRILVAKEDAIRLQHGMSIDVSFVLGEKLESLMVPANAVIKTKRGFGVYLIRDNITRWTSVTPSIQEEGWIGVEADLKKGDRVVAGNLEVVKDALEVYPVSIERDVP